MKKIPNSAVSAGNKELSTQDSKVENYLQEHLAADICLDY